MKINPTILCTLQPDTLGALVIIISCLIFAGCIYAVLLGLAVRRSGKDT